MRLGNGSARCASTILKGKRRRRCRGWYLWALIRPTSPTPHHTKQTKMEIVLHASGMRPNRIGNEANKISRQKSRGGKCKERGRERVDGKKLSGRQSELPLAAGRTHNRKWKIWKNLKLNYSSSTFGFFSFIINSDIEQHWRITESGWVVNVAGICTYLASFNVPESTNA